MYMQNHKELANYSRLIDENKFAVSKGYPLSEIDEIFKKYILETACKGKVVFERKHLNLLEQYSIPRLRELSADGLVSLNENGFAVTETGCQFLRNICQAFDLKWWQSENFIEKNIFSKAV
jgi:oxygen-independent coproporphyrinogen-3 oxidase